MYSQADIRKELKIDMVDSELPAEGTKRRRKQRVVPGMVPLSMTPPSSPSPSKKQSAEQVPPVGQQGGRVKMAARTINGEKIGSKKVMEARGRARMVAEQMAEEDHFRTESEGASDSDDVSKPKLVARKTTGKMPVPQNVKLEEEEEVVEDFRVLKKKAAKEPAGESMAAFGGGVTQTENVLTFGDLAPGKSVEIFDGKFLDAVGLIQTLTGKDRRHAAESLRIAIDDGAFDAGIIINKSNAGTIHI